jgi:hypothetical protein
MVERLSAGALRELLVSLSPKLPEGEYHNVQIAGALLLNVLKESNGRNGLNLNLVVKIQKP